MTTNLHIEYEHLDSSQGCHKIGKCSTIWRLICVLMCIFFVFATYVQHNDPDPLEWMIVYGFAAIVTLSISIHPPLPGYPWFRAVCIFYITICVMACFYTCVLLLQVMPTSIHNPLQWEEGRELAGLLIIIAWVYICCFTNINRSEIPTRAPTSTLLTVSVAIGVLPLLAWGLCFIPDAQSYMGHCRDMFPQVTPL